MHASQIQNILKHNRRFDGASLLLDINGKRFTICSKKDADTKMNLTNSGRIGKLLLHDNGDINITPYVKLDGDGLNVAKVTLCFPHYYNSTESFICLVQVLEKLTLEKIMDRVKKVPFSDGKMWIKTYFTKQSKDIEIPFVNMSLKCPLSTGRLVCPVRTSTCKHLQCFDLETFWKYMAMGGKLNKKSTCPICKAPASIGDIRICGYTQQILNDLVSEDAENAVVMADGSYHAKNSKLLDTNGSSSISKKRKRSGSDSNNSNGTVVNNKVYENVNANVVVILSSDDDENDIDDGHDEHEKQNENIIDNANLLCSQLPASSTLLPLSVVQSTITEYVNTSRSSTSGSTYDDAIVLD